MSAGTGKEKGTLSLNQKGKRAMVKEMDRKWFCGRSAPSKGSWSHEVVKAKMADEIRKALFSGDPREKCREEDNEVGKQDVTFPKNAFPTFLGSGPNWANIHYKKPGLL